MASPCPNDEARIGTASACSRRPAAAADISCRAARTSGCRRQGHLDGLFEAQPRSGGRAALRRGRRGGEAEGEKDRGRRDLYPMCHAHSISPICPEAKGPFGVRAKRGDRKGGMDPGMFPADVKREISSAGARRPVRTGPENGRSILPRRN